MKVKLFVTKIVMGYYCYASSCYVPSGVAAEKPRLHQLVGASAAARRNHAGFKHKLQPERTELIKSYVVPNSVSQVLAMRCCHLRWFASYLTSALE